MKFHTPRSKHEKLFLLRERNRRAFIGCQMTTGLRDAGRGFPKLAGSGRGAVMDSQGNVNNLG